MFSSRFLAVLKPHTYQQWLFVPSYRRSLLVAIATIWIWGILISFILYVYLYDRQEHSGEKCRYEMQYGFHHALFGFCVVTLLSVVVMVAVYAAMVRVYRKQVWNGGSFRLRHKQSYNALFVLMDIA